MLTHDHLTDSHPSQVVETKARAEIDGREYDIVTYCDHFAHPESDPDIDGNDVEISEYDEVKE